MVNDTFQYRAGQLHADGVDLRALAAEVGTPCYVYSRERALANLQRLRGAFPRAEIHYSLKANANLSLVRLLIEAGAGLDAVSGGEVFRAMRAGADPAQIVFAGVGKTKGELAYALEVGVGWLNVESSLELGRIARLANSMDRQARVAVRVNPNIQADTHHYIATGHAAAKFGVPLDEVEALLRKYTRSKCITIEGLHVHIGSQLGSVERTVEAVQRILPLFEAHPQFRTLNLGGGFPVSYTGEAVPPVEAFAAALEDCLQGRDLRILLEPGRYIIADAGILLVEVQYVKSSSDGVIVVTDGGMTELIRPALYSATHQVLSIHEPSNGERVRTDVVGPVCESADVLRSDVLLPALQPGDLLAILHAGAYGAVMGSTYNARPRPPEVLVEGDSWRLIRRRETWNDLVALEETKPSASESGT
jgi:diaminopimelate decarboxylase